MAGVDYLDGGGLDDALSRWLDAVADVDRAGRPAGDPAHAALVVLDLQAFFCDPASHAHLPAARHVLPRVATLARAFRDAGSPVIFTRHALAEGEDPGRMGDWWGDVVREGQPRAALWPAAGALPGDPVLRKTTYDAFAGTGLAARLADAGITSVVLAGVMTHLCVETTARAAFLRGLFVQVAADGTASADEALHVGALRSLAHGFARVRSCRALARWRSSAPEASGGATGAARAAVTGHPASEPVDLAVVGAGPAGLAAAVQATRQGLSVVLLEASRPGGLLHQADLVENYLGAGWLEGAELAARLVAQAARSGVRPRTAEVERVTAGGGDFQLALAGGDALQARTVVLATGTRARAPELPGLASVLGHSAFLGVAELRASWAEEPGRAVVIGGGDIALDGAASLRRRGWRVEVLVRGEAPRALDLLSRRLRELGATLTRRAQVEQVEGDAGGLRLRGLQDGAARTWTADRLLIAVGREPRLPPVVDARQGEPGRPLVFPAEAGTLPGLVLAGDVARGRDRQAAIAAGDGVAAAMAVARLLAKESPR